MTIEKVNIRDKLTQFSDRWKPKIVGELNGQHVKLVKIQGEFIWHKHDAEDEMFLVTKGELHIKWRDTDGSEHDDTIRPGELIIVPHGTEHMPYTLEETHVILFEPAGTLNTGNVQNERTVADLQKI